MSELIQKHDNRATIRWKLLTGASALALTAYVSSSSLARADDSERPLIWIELGGQLSRLSDDSGLFAPDFLSMRPSMFTPSQTLETSPRFGFDEYGKISFQPENSDWVLSASIRYGRALKSRHVRQQSYPGKMGYDLYPTLPSRNIHLSKYPRAARFADTTVRNSERHGIIDFQAGKDVGLGLFGRNGSSVVNLGVRFAQFHDKSNSILKSDPDWHFQNKYYDYAGAKLNFLVQPYHSNAADFRADRTFRGVGPSLSWSGSVAVAGNAQSTEMDFDWGVNAALLFGRQKTRIQQQTTMRYNDGGKGVVAYGSNANGYGALTTVYQHAPPPQTRSRNVSVPNAGGFAGLSLRYGDAKVSFGYRADFFFGAIDGGIAAQKKENRGFFGPFASVSVGLGD